MIKPKGIVPTKKEKQMSALRSITKQDEPEKMESVKDESSEPKLKTRITEHY